MADDPLRDLLSSPLEPDRADRPGDRPPKERRSWTVGPWFALGIALGALAMVIGVLIGGEEPSSPPTTAVTTTASAAAPPAVLALPPGYTSIADGRLGARVERVLVRTDAVFVSVSTVVPSGLDGDQTAGLTGALWQLDLIDGRSLESIGESRSASSPGFVTIRFEAGDFGADDIAALRVVGLATRLGDEHASRVRSGFTLPDDQESSITVALEPASFELDTGVTLVLGDIEFQDGTGTLEWWLEGSDGDARATVFPQLTITDPATGADFAVLTQGAFGGFVFNPSGLNFFEDAAMSRNGSVTFEAADPQAAALPTGVQLDASLELSVSWDVFTPADVTIPIGDAPVAEL